MGMFSTGMITESIENAFADPNAIISQMIEMEVSQLPYEKIEGKVVFRFWPFNVFGTI